MIERIRRASAKAGLNGQSIAPASPERWALFGPPQLLEGEDAAVLDMGDRYLVAKLEAQGFKVTLEPAA